MKPLPIFNLCLRLPLAILPVLMVLALGIVGCTGSPEEYETGDANPATQTFTGPKYLRGTIGSYGEFANRNPHYVGGYGMVVDLNGTGSTEVPAFAREWLVNEMLRNKVGSVSFGTEQFTPERVMADLGSSVVAVEGLIPPGARRGSKFDVLVTMVDQTSTSLAGGRLFWPTQLSPLGLDRRLIYTESKAVGYGELFVNPVKPIDSEANEFLRQAVVVNGGTVIESQTVRYTLNQSSYRIASLIANRINERFESTDDDNFKTAEARSDSLIDINMPKRFAGQPEELLALIEHLYLDPTPGFVKPQAEALAQALIEAPTGRSRSVSLAWKGLGPNATPVLRELYNHENPVVRDTALEAGAWLGDRQAVAPLAEFAEKGDKAQRIFAAQSLVAMTRNERARVIVRSLLDDPDVDVRMAAYEALAMVSDPIISRLSVHDGTEHKFYIDRVPSDKPMVYVVQGEEQSIVIFGEDIPLRNNVFARLGDTLTLRTLSAETIPIGLRDRFAGDTAFVPIHRCGALKMIPSRTPVSKEPGAEAPPPDWSVEIGDGQGNGMMLNIRNTALQDLFGVEVLNKPNRGKATKEPRLYALVRVVRVAGKDAAGNDGPAIAELLDLRPPDTALPIALRYLPPGEREPKVYRINPTVATFVYTLGFKRDDLNTQFGPDLSFSQVVRALHQLSEQEQLPAPFFARISPLAQRIAKAQEESESVEPRPEITPEELELLKQQDPVVPDPNAPPTDGDAGAEPQSDQDPASDEPESGAADASSSAQRTP